MLVDADADAMNVESKAGRWTSEDVVGQLGVTDLEPPKAVYYPRPHKSLCFSFVLLLVFILDKRLSQSEAL